MAEPLGELDTSGASRVKQLEAMVLRLEKENQHLLNRVTDSAEKYREKASNGVVFDTEDCTRESMLHHAPYNDDLISLNEHGGDGEDEWLFSSPIQPATPSQKQMTPTEWLISREDEGEEEEELPSLDEVRKALSFQIAGAETISSSSRRHLEASPLSKRSKSRHKSNHSAQKYVSHGRRHSKSPSSPTPDDSPLAQARIWKAKNPQNASLHTEEAVPIVRWKKPILPQEEPQSLSAEETVPIVQWKAKMPVEDAPAINTGVDEPVPVVRWRARMPRDSSPNNDVPVVKWKARMPQESPNVPIVKWKAKMPQDSSRSEDVPVTNQESEITSRVADSPQDESSGSADVPPVSWRPPKPRNVPVKAIICTARTPQSESSEFEEEEEEGGREVELKGPAPQRARLPAPSSPRLFRHRSPGGCVPRPHASRVAVPASGPLRSRSPSPHFAAAITSRSPSPHHSAVVITSRSPSPRHSAVIITSRSPSPRHSAVAITSRSPSPHHSAVAITSRSPSPRQSLHGPASLPQPPHPLSPDTDRRHIPVTRGGSHSPSHTPPGRGMQRMFSRKEPLMGPPSGSPLGPPRLPSPTSKLTPTQVGSSAAKRPPQPGQAGNSHLRPAGGIASCSPQAGPPRPTAGAHRRPPGGQGGLQRTACSPQNDPPMPAGGKGRLQRPSGALQRRLQSPSRAHPVVTQLETGAQGAVQRQGLRAMQSPQRHGGPPSPHLQTQPTRKMTPPSSLPSSSRTPGSIHGNHRSSGSPSRPRTHQKLKSQEQGQDSTSWLEGCF